MSDTSIKHDVAQGTVWLSVSSIVTRTIWLVISFIVLSTLTVREFGIIELMLSVIAALSFFSLPGLYNIVLNDIGLEKGKDNIGSAYSLLKQYFLYLAVPSVVAWGILFFGAEIISVTFSDFAGDLLRIISFYFLIVPFISPTQVVLMLDSKYPIVALRQLVSAISKLTVIVSVMYFSNLTVAWVLVAHISMDYVGMLVISPFVLKSLKVFKSKNNTEKVSLLKIILSHGKWAIFAAYLNDATKSFRLWVIKILLGTEAVGLYAAALGIMTQVRSILPLSKILSAIIPQHKPSSPVFNKLVVKGIKYNVIGVFLLGVGAACTVPILIYILLPQYIPSILLFEIMLLSMLPVSVGGVLSIIFYVLQKQRNLFFANLLRFAVTVLTLPVFIILFGLPGAAIELITASLFFMFERIRRVRHELPNMQLSWRALVTYDDLDRITLLAIKNKIYNTIPFTK